MAVLKYYDGSDWEPIASALVGPTGPTGVTGATGATGATGPTAGLILLNTTSFSGAVSSVSLPASTFTSDYANYKIIFTFPQTTTASANLTINARLRAASTDDSSSAYSFNGFQSAGSLTNNTGLNQTSITTCFVRTGFEERSFISMEIFNPQLATETGISITSFGDNAGTFTNLFLNGLLNTTTVYDSLTFLFSGGTLLGGKISAYGYNK